MAFAELWEGFLWPSGEVMRSFCVVKMAANVETAMVLPDARAGGMAGLAGWYGRQSPGEQRAGTAEGDRQSNGGRDVDGAIAPIDSDRR